MYRNPFVGGGGVDEEMDLAGFAADRSCLSSAVDRFPVDGTPLDGGSFDGGAPYFLAEDPADYGTGAGSMAIPINARSGGVASNLSGSNDTAGTSSGRSSSCSASSSLPNNHIMGGDVPQFSAFLGSMINEQQKKQQHQSMLHHQQPNVPRSLAFQGGGARHFAGQFVGSMPHDPYPSPVMHQMRPAQSDHLSMVYGQSCPEATFQLQQQQQHMIPGMKTIHQPPTNIFSTQPSMADLSPPNSLSGSIFQFRTSNPASAEQIVEKQKKRKESHNAVERRRRDHINEMIQQLGGLVEECEGEAGRLNKGEILQRSVERIRILQRIVEAQRERLAQLDPGFVLPDLSRD